MDRIDRMDGKDANELFESGRARRESCSSCLSLLFTSRPSFIFEQGWTGLTGWTERTRTSFVKVVEPGVNPVHLVYPCYLLQDRVSNLNRDGQDDRMNGKDATELCESGRARRESCSSCLSLLFTSRPSFIFEQGWTGLTGWTERTRTSFLKVVEPGVNPVHPVYPCYLLQDRVSYLNRDGQDDRMNGKDATELCESGRARRES